MDNEKLKNEILLLFSQYYEAPPEERFIGKLVEISSRFEPPVKPEIADIEYDNLMYKYMVACRTLAYQLKGKEYDTETINAFGMIVDDIPEI